MKAFVSLIVFCSGTGAKEAIRWSQTISLASFALMVVLFLVLLFMKPITWKLRAVFAGLILIHPHLWMNAISGDCGYVMRYSSIALFIVFLAVWLFIIFKKRITAPPTP